ncbi:MAG: hypothetical protein AMJ61_16955, partial [Desulfobacterales bacterium SG8_35_2]
MVALFVYVDMAYAALTNVSSRLLLNLGIQYDSNFYFDPIDERGVTTYLIQPGIELGYETGKSEIAFNYMLDANYYDESSEDDFYGHNAFLIGDFELSDRLSFNLSDNFRYTYDTAELDDLGNIRTREKYYQNRLRALFALDFEPKFTTQFGYQNWITDYKDDTSVDSMGNQGILDLIYHLNSSTSLDLEYHYWNMDYDGPVSDYTSNQLSLVARKEFRIVDLEAAVGYQKRKFDEPALEDAEVVPYRLILNGRSSSGKSRFSLSVARNFNFLVTSDQGYYEANRFSLNLDHDLTGKITVGVRGYFQNSDYDNSIRDDDTYNILADINYQMRERI